MVTKIAALYRDWICADAVVERLVEAGFDHSALQLKSGHFWPELLDETGDSDYFSLEGGEVVLEFQSSAEAWRETAREVLFASGPLGVQIDSSGHREVWTSIPVTAAYFRSETAFLLKT